MRILEQGLMEKIGPQIGETMLPSLPLLHGSGCAKGAAGRIEQRNLFGASSLPFPVWVRLRGEVAVRALARMAGDGRLNRLRLADSPRGNKRKRACSDLCRKRGR